MANWTVATLYRRLNELIELGEVKDSDTVGKLREHLRELIVDEALTTRDRKKEQAIAVDTPEIPGQSTVDEALKAHGGS